MPTPAPVFTRATSGPLRQVKSQHGMRYGSQQLARSYISLTVLAASDWFTHGWGIFLAGTVMIAGLTYIQYRGAGVYFKWQRWATYLALGSLALTIFVLILAAAGVLDFRAHFDALAGHGAYAK